MSSEAIRKQPGIEQRGAESVSLFRSRTLLLAIAVIAAWSIGLAGDFVLDDQVEIVQGEYRLRGFSDLTSLWTQTLDQINEPNSRDSDSGGGYFRPLYAISLSVDWSIWEARPALYHAENIIWHLLVVVGLFALGRRQLHRHANGESIAFWSALLFAIHPLGVHSVTWISGRDDLMCAAFSVFCLLAFARVAIDGHEPRSGKFSVLLWGLLAATCLVFAILSKELAIVVPLVATVWLYVEFFDEASPRRWFSWACLGLLWTISLGAAFFHYRVLGTFGVVDVASWPGDTLWGNVGTLTRLWWWYVARVLFPLGPTIVDRWAISHEMEVVETISSLGLLVVAIGILVALWRRPWSLQFALWYVIWMLPASGLLPLREFYAEGYLYPASWGLVGLFVMLVFRLLQREFPTFRQTVLCVIAGALFVATVIENRHWRDDETLLTHAIAQDSDFVQGRAGLAAIALRKRQNELAAKHGALAIKSAQDPDYLSHWSPFVAHTNQGLALQNLGKFEEAETHFVQARLARPATAIAHYHLGLNATAQNKLDEAEEHYKLALERKSGDFLTESNLGYVLLLQQRLEECIQILSPLVQAFPNDMKNRANLGTAYLLSRDYSAAEQQFAEIVRQRPNEAVHLAKLAWAEWKLGKTDQALSHLLASTEIQRDHPTVRHVAQMMQDRLQPRAPLREE